jgi:hypothetical protein
MIIQRDDLTSQLAAAEFAHLRFECCMQEDIDLDLFTVLRLRRRLRSVAQEVLHIHPQMFRRIFEPLLSTDPVALRRYQKGAPAFVIAPETVEPGHYSAGDVCSFEIYLFGDVAVLAPGLIEVFAALGKTGLRLDAGKYKLERVCAADAGGHFIPVWHAMQGGDGHNIPQLDLGWWLGGQSQACSRVKLEFSTPARLLTRGRPMFHPDFAHLFPFVLRRVTSMLYIHCDTELDPRHLGVDFEVIELNETESTLHWHDWRHLHREHGENISVGGVCGSLILEGDIAPPLLSLLQLGRLFNLGKNAAYGAGSYVIEYEG